MSTAGLRDYFEKQGQKVGWDAKTGNVSIGNNNYYTPDYLKSMGGVLQNGSWQMPTSFLQNISTGSANNKATGNTQSNPLTDALKGLGTSSISLDKGNYNKIQNNISKLLSNKPTHSMPNFQVYQPQQMDYQDALQKVGGSYEMKNQDELQKVAQLLADLEANPQREALDQQRQRQELQYHNMMKQAENAFQGKDQAISDLKNKLNKQQSQDLVARGASMRSGLAEYHSSKMNEAVAQQLTHLELNKQTAIENLMSEHSLNMEQIDTALLSLEQQRGKLSAAHFSNLSSREQEIYLQQENARSQVALNIMNQFMNGEQSKLQASLAQIEAADRRYATEIQAWLGNLDGLLKQSSQEASMQQSALSAALQGKGLELDYLQTLLPYTQMTTKDKAMMDYNWADLMGLKP